MSTVFELVFLEDSTPSWHCFGFHGSQNFFCSPLFCPSSLFFLCQTTVVGTRVSVVHVQCCWVTVR